MTENLTQVVDFIPYRIKDGKREFFLQRRTENAPRFSGFFALFGGFLEPQDSLETGLMKRLNEKLNYKPAKYTYLGFITLPRKEKHIYTSEVEGDFEEKIKILEGMGGKWFKEEEIFEDYIAPWIMPQDLLVLSAAMQLFKKA